MRRHLDSLSQQRFGGFLRSPRKISALIEIYLGKTIPLGGSIRWMSSYNGLRSAGRIDGKPLAVGTVRRAHSALHAALAHAQRWSWVFENVADHVTPLGDEPAEMRLPNPAQVAQLLRSLLAIRLSTSI